MVFLAINKLLSPLAIEGPRLMKQTFALLLLAIAFAIPPLAHAQLLPQALHELHLVELRKFQLSVYDARLQNQ